MFNFLKRLLANRKEQYRDECPKEHSGIDLPHEGLLNFIGKVESNNHYNAHFGKVRSGVPFTTMTLDQVYDWQNHFVRVLGKPSSAVGKYQIIRGTLKNLMRQMKLTGTELFDENMQDTMALKLLNGRGYQKFLTGGLTTEQFANNIAKEWASMPVVTGSKKGRSYYAGDSLNKSLVSVEDFLAAVEGAR